MNKRRIALFMAAALCFSLCFGVQTAMAEETGDMQLIGSEETDYLHGVSEIYSCDEGSIKVTVTARGIESDVVLDVYIDADGLVDKIDVISHGETPALGGMALSEDYLSAYYGAGSTDEIDAYAGATVTSDAIKKCVNIAINQYKALNGLEYTEDLTSEELLAAELEEYLGADYVQLDVELLDMVTAVYESETGYAFCAEGKGHAEEPIKLAVFTDKDGIVRHISVIESSETEGIGSKVLAQTNLFFYYGGSSFAMIDIPGTYRIDLVSGATETSLGTMKIVNAAVKQFAALPEQG